MTTSAKSTHSAAKPAAVVQRAITQILRPLVKLLLAHGITYPALAEVLKSLYVEVADKNFHIVGKAQTDSRVSLLSGVHRKDVRRLRATPDDISGTSSQGSLASEILAAWAAPPFIDKRNHPLPLARLARAAEGEPSFEALVESVSKDIRPRAVLDEWLRLDIVYVDQSDRVCLRQSAFVKDEAFVEKAFYLEHNLRDHAAASVHNMLGGAPGFLERSVYGDKFSEASVVELAEFSEKAGMEALRAVIRKAIKLDRRDKQGKTAGKRMTFGIYFYSEDTASTVTKDLDS
jgi:hypothetical protein